MDMQIRATITRNSNGSVDLRPVAGEANPFNIERVTLHTHGTPSAKDFPVDGEATLAISSGVRTSELRSAVARDLTAAERADAVANPDGVAMRNSAAGEQLAAGAAVGSAGSAPVPVERRKR